MDADVFSVSYVLEENVTVRWYFYRRFTDIKYGAVKYLWLQISKYKIFFLLKIGME